MSDPAKMMCRCNHLLPSHQAFGETRCTRCPCQEFRAPLVIPETIVAGVNDAAARRADAAGVQRTHWVGDNCPGGHEEDRAQLEGKPFVKHDAGKLRMDLLPASAIHAVSEVLGYGAAKYAPGNWRKTPSRARYMAACLRHLFARMTGEVVDPESGLAHLAHAATCALFLVACEDEGLGADDLAERPEVTP